MTTYVIFRGDSETVEDPSGWIVLGSIEAHSAKQAIRRYAEQHKDFSRFAAVPARSWETVMVERTTVEQIRFS